MAIMLDPITTLGTLDPIDFSLPPELEATAPAEARGLTRDGVRLLVSHRSHDEVAHTQFRDIGNYLAAGDVLVINTSGTLNAALPVSRANGATLVMHLSTRLPADLWVVELRQPDGTTTRPFRENMVGETLTLPGNASATVLTPYLASHRYAPEKPNRLWLATLRLPISLLAYLERYGAPIRYSYVPEVWPSDAYQTVYVTEMGSAEMPSAGRAFTSEVLTGLMAQGVQIAPLLLHTGVASLEDHEPPYEEWYRVPEATARLVNSAHAAGRRVIAVGTTVVRSLETIVDTEGMAHPGEGWTKLVITPARGVCVVDGLLTGFHEPRATHLAMLEAFASRERLSQTYAEALREHYLWHEFGDLHLLLP